MKKNYFLGLIAACLFSSLPAYADDFDYNTDFQYMFQTVECNNFWVTRGDDGYYIRNCDILYYADSNLEMVFPLCSKPECMHDNEPDWQERVKCEAYLGNSSVESTIQLNNGNFFTVSAWDFEQEEPYRDLLGRAYILSEDGLYRKEMDLQPFESMSTAPIVHRGYCYYLALENHDESDGKVTTETCLFRKSIEKEEAEEKLFSSSDIDSFTQLTACGDYVYYVYWILNDCYTLVYNTKTQEVSYLSNGNGTKPIFSFENNKMLITYLGTGEEKQPLVVADLDGTVTEVMEEFMVEEGWYVSGDGTWLYTENCNDEDVVIYHTKPRVLRYYDRETLQYAGEVELGYDVDMLPCPVGDDRYIFYKVHKDRDYNNCQIWYIDKADLANNAPQPKMLIEGAQYSIGWTWMD